MDGLYIVGKCSKCFQILVEILTIQSFGHVQLRWELVYLCGASTWNVNFREQIDLTNSLNDVESVHLVVQASPTSLKMHGLSVV